MTGLMGRCKTCLWVRRTAIVSVQHSWDSHWKKGSTRMGTAADVTKNLPWLWAIKWPLASGESRLVTGLEECVVTHLSSLSVGLVGLEMGGFLENGRGCTNRSRKWCGPQQRHNRCTL